MDMNCYALSLIPRPLLPIRFAGEGEKSPSPEGEGFRVKAKITTLRNVSYGYELLRSTLARFYSFSKLANIFLIEIYFLRVASVNSHYNLYEQTFIVE